LHDSGDPQLDRGRATSARVFGLSAPQIAHIGKRVKASGVSFFAPSWLLMTGPRVQGAAGGGGAPATCCFRLPPSTASDHAELPDTQAA